MEASLYSLVPAGEGAEVLFNVPAPEEIPWPNKIAAPPSAPSSDDDFQQDLDVWLGPSSTLPGKLSGREARLKMSLESIRSCASHHSSRHCLQLSDYLRLKLGPVREKEAAIRPQLSFGSALHVGDGVNALCRVCSGLLAGSTCASVVVCLSASFLIPRFPQAPAPPMLEGCTLRLLPPARWTAQQAPAEPTRTWLCKKPVTGISRHRSLNYISS